MSNIEGLTALQRRFAAITDNRKMLGQIALLAVKEAKELVPRQTGNLGRSIRLGTVTDANAQIIAGGREGVGYARWVEFGTPGGQMIRPVRKKALAWGGARRLSGSLRTGAKAEFFSMGHKRGATRAKPYLIPGAKRAVEKAGLAKTIVTAWNDAA